MKKKLCKSSKDKKICGVCGGFAEYLNADPTIIRLITVALVFVFGMSVWVYIIAALVMPEDTDSNNTIEG